MTNTNSSLPGQAPFPWPHHAPPGPRPAFGNCNCTEAGHLQSLPSDNTGVLRDVCRNCNSIWLYCSICNFRINETKCNLDAARARRDLDLHGKGKRIRKSSNKHRRKILQTSTMTASKALELHDCLGGSSGGVGDTRDGDIEFEGHNGGGDSFNDEKYECAPAPITSPPVVHAPNPPPVGCNYDYELDPDVEDIETDHHGPYIVRQEMKLEVMRRNLEFNEVSKFTDALLGMGADEDESGDLEGDSSSTPTSSDLEVDSFSTPTVLNRNNFTYFDKWGDKKNRKAMYMFQKSLHKTQEFGEHNNEEREKGGGSGGWIGLVGRCLSHCLSDAEKFSRSDEAAHMFRLLNVMLNAQGALKDDIVLLIQSLFDTFVAKVNPDVCAHPRDMSSINGLVLKGSNSIFRNFPAQSTFEIHGHACVSLIETILLMMGHGADCNFAKRPGWKGSSPTHTNEEGLNGTPAVAKMIEDAVASLKAKGLTDEEISQTFIGWIVMWSDSYLQSFIKQKENSVHTTTATICPPESNKSSSAYTVVLALGKSSLDHTKVVAFYMEELDQLKAGIQCYCGRTNRIERFVFVSPAWAGDRPENQSITGTMKEGIFGKVSTFAVAIDEKKLPACHACYSKTIQKVTGKQMRSQSAVRCNGCCDWNIKHNDYATAIGMKDYPTSKQKVFDENGTEIKPPKNREPGATKLGCVELSSEQLHNAAKYAYAQLARGHWTKKETEAWLRTNNIKGSIADHVLATAEVDREARRYFPSSFVAYELWTGEEKMFGSFQFPVLPMHGLFHGKGNDHMNVLNTILVHYKRMTHFCDYANRIIAEIQTFGVDYLKVKPFPKLAWVAENSMAAIRLVPYLYGTYLMSHPLKSSSDHSTERLMKLLRCFINSFQAYVAVLMSVDKPPLAETIQNHAKLYMSSAHYLELEFRLIKSSSKPSRKEVPKSPEEVVKKAIDKLLVKELDCIFTDLGSLECIRGERKDVKQDKLRGMTSAEIRSFLDSQKVSYSAGASRAELMLQMFKVMDIISDKNSEREMEQRMWWNKGYWLTFLTIVPDQVQYLGPLRFIW